MSPVTENDTEKMRATLVRLLRNFFTGPDGRLISVPAAEHAMDILGLGPGDIPEDRGRPADIAELESTLMTLYYVVGNIKPKADRIAVYRIMFTTIGACDPKDLPYAILRNISSFGLPKDEITILRKTLSYCPEKFIEAICASTMQDASVAVSGIAGRIDMEADRINELFRDIIAAYGMNPEIRSEKDELEIYADESDVWGDAQMDLANALLGNADSQYEIGMRYLHGDGVTQSDERYVKWISRSAEQQYYEAEYEMYEIYSMGIGVQEDPELAEKYLYRGAVHGSEKARKVCEEQGISLDIGTCAYCGKEKAWYMTEGGPICRGCMPKDLLQYCAEVDKGVIERWLMVRGNFIC